METHADVFLRVFQTRFSKIFMVLGTMISVFTIFIGIGAIVFALVGENAAFLAGGVAMMYIPMFYLLVQYFVLKMVEKND